MKFISHLIFTSKSEYVDNWIQVDVDFTGLNTPRFPSKLIGRYVIESVKSWGEQNCSKRFAISVFKGKAYFEDPNDAMLFRLSFVEAK